MSYASAYICGVARNCAPYLPAVLTNIQAIASLFIDYKIIIVVAADSKEDICLLTEFACQQSTHVILYIDNAPMSAIRTVNIARARNICLKIMRKINANTQYPYFIMMDCDAVCSAPIKCDILQSVLTTIHSNQWDAISFNSDPYYDIWALAAPPFIFSCANFVGGKRKWAWHLWRRMAADKAAGRNITQVWSAFGGFAIYRTALFLAHKDIVYDGCYRLDYIPATLLSENIRAVGSPIYSRQTPQTPYVETGGDCEHRHFHLTAVMKYGAHIGICHDVLFGSGSNADADADTKK